MEALVTAFVASALAEWGDKTQLLAVFLVSRTGRPDLVLGALLVAVCTSSGLAAMAGLAVADLLSGRAMILLVSLALLFAGAIGLVRRSPPRAEGSRPPFFAAASILFLAAEFGDRSQFLTFAIAGRFASFWLATAGAVTGTTAAVLPALLLGERLAVHFPVRKMRLAAAVLFLFSGFAVAIQALRLA